MKAILRIFILIALFWGVFGYGLYAQSNSEYSVRFKLFEVDCANSVVTVDLELKANEGFPGFYVSDQNYRFSFNRVAVANPRIVTELGFSGVMVSNEYNAYFDPHHLNGSLDTVISYNVVLAGGTGFPVDDTQWYPVGRIAFDVLDGNECLELKWHTHDPFDFPPTFVGEKYGGFSGTLFEVEEGTYDNGGPGLACYSLACPPLPIELSSFEGFDRGDCTTELIWKTASETDNDYFIVQKSDDGEEWRNVGDKILGFGAGTSTDPRTYSYEDKVLRTIVSYYRIMQVDITGEVSFSDAVNVRSSCYNDQIAIGITDLYPNPVMNNDRVNIKFYTERGDSQANIVVTDELGRIVKDIVVELREGPNTLSFKAGSLSPGIYFVQVKGDNWYSVVQKIVKVIAE